MDLLEFGMRNEKSESAVKRTMAKAALGAVKKKADLYEAYLKQQGEVIPDLEAEVLLKKIREEIASCPKEQAARL